MRRRAAACGSERASCPRLDPAPGGRLALTFDPDGEFRFDRNESDVLVVDADGSGERRLTRTPVVQERSPAFSPRGDRIAFAGETRAGDLYLIRPDGSGRRRLTRAAATEAFPSWSPDGRRIAFAAGRQIHVMDARGRRARRVTGGQGRHLTPAWQP